MAGGTTPGGAADVPAATVAVVLPVKDFGQAKARLAADLDPAQRDALARWTADRVVAACGDSPVFVVCDSRDVAAWAESRGATVIWEPGVGLNAAATRAVDAVARTGASLAVVAHSDLPLAHDLSRLARPGAAVLVPDSRDDGTNVLGIPTEAGFRFSYGRRSFTAHLAEARRLGLDAVVVRDEALALDIDTSDDLSHPSLRPILHEVLPAWTPRTNPANPH